MFLGNGLSFGSPRYQAFSPLPHLVVGGKDKKGKGQRAWKRV